MQTSMIAINQYIHGRILHNFVTSTIKNSLLFANSIMKLMAGHLMIISIGTIKIPHLTLMRKKTNTDNVTLTAKTTDFSSIIKRIIESDDRLFFISQKIPNQVRKEWRIAQINLKESLRQHK